MDGVLFLCVANCARSQLAEAIARSLDPGGEYWSAGSEPSHVRPEVRRVLEEADISAQGLRSKGIPEVPADEMDTVITLCADEICPWLPGPVKRLHWPLPDPASAPADERLDAFRATRDELQRRLKPFIAARKRA